MPIFLLAAGALLGAVAGGTIGYTAAGLTGAGLGLGVGALAGLGFGAAVYGFAHRPIYWYPIPCPPYYAYYAPIYYRAPVYFAPGF
jgi:hypothetical protein